MRLECTFSPLEDWVSGAARERLAKRAAARGFAGPLGPRLEPEDLLLEEDRLREESSDPMDELRDFEEDEELLRLLSEGLRLLNLPKKNGFFLGFCFESMICIFNETDRKLRATKIPAISSVRYANFEHVVFWEEINNFAMFPGWMASLARSAAQDSEGLWPKDKLMYDPGNYCEQQGPSKDSFDSNGAKMTIRSSSSEGMFYSQEECCESLWCGDKCDQFRGSQCKSTGYGCESSCETGGDSSHHEEKHKSHHQNHDHGDQSECNVTIKGVQYCGKDCGQAKKDNFGCWEQEHCTEVDASNAAPNKIYFAKLAQCCAGYTALNGGALRSGEHDETMNRCMNDPEFQNRVTDYPMQEPACEGGYEDQGKFPSPAQPSKARKPCPGPPPTMSRPENVPGKNLPPTTSPPGSIPGDARTPAGATSPPHPYHDRHMQHHRAEHRTMPKHSKADSQPHAQTRPMENGSPRGNNPFGMHRNGTAGMRGSPPRMTRGETRDTRGLR
jgi:hypothetical protein